MSSRYNHKKVETFWQQKWTESKTFQTKTNKSKKKYYVLEMFPYPSVKIHINKKLTAGHIIDCRIHGIKNNVLQAEHIQN